VSTPNPELVSQIAARHHAPAERIGVVRAASDKLEIKLPRGALRAPLSRLSAAYHNAIPTIMARTPEHATFDELAPVAAH